MIATGLTAGMDDLARTLKKLASKDVDLHVVASALEKHVQEASGEPLAPFIGPLNFLLATIFIVWQPQPVLN